MSSIPAALLVFFSAHPILAQTDARSAEPVAAASESASKPAATPVESAAPATPSATTPSDASAAARPFVGQVLSSAENDYVLTPGDTVEMTIFREPELTTRSTIARDGTVQLPLVQEVQLAGKTVRDARNYLRGLYGKSYLVNPQVYLNIVQFAQRKFTIMGQVARPGSYQLEGGQTLDLLEAVGMAGGFTRIADRGRVLIKRRVNGEVETIRANAKRMAEGKVESVTIQPGDIITVGESWF